MPAPKNLFQFTFNAGDLVPDTEFARFEKFLPRIPNEPDKHYAQRLEQAGLAMVMTSEETRDITQFKSTLDAARDAGLPVAILTNPQPDYIRERLEERQQKSAQDYLTEARAQAQGGSNADR